MTLVASLRQYAARVRELAANATTAEDTYYQPIRQLLADTLAVGKLPLDVRTGTKEARPDGKGIDRPDLAFYEADGSPSVYVEVKLLSAELSDMAASTDRNDQIGRYLAATGVVILCNVRGFALLACKPGTTTPPGQPVPPAARDLRAVFELWSSSSAMISGQPVATGAAEALIHMVDEAVTELAHLVDPASLARVLARHARRAKADLPVKFVAGADLLEDYQEGLGLHFEGAEEDEFFRCSVVQTAFYALFAGWTLWHRAKDGRAFTWQDIDRYLRIPFLGKMFYEFRHPDRMDEMGLAKHLDRAQATLERVDRDAFFARFLPPRGDLADAVDPRAFQAITYFYEPFLEAFDPDLRNRLGVWYTPPEIVRYQVKTVDRLLRDQLGCAKGLADDRVVVLDPCCGTGAYLLEVLRLIAVEVERKQGRDMLAAELLQAVRTRVIGFEILMAPFVVSHLQLHLMLSDLGVTPGPADRPAVFLTNALTGWDEDDQVKLRFPEMRVERELAGRVKREAKIIVIIGNPPYNRFAAAMREEVRLVDPYKGIRRKVKKNKAGITWVQDGTSDLYTRYGIRKQLLNDLYIRFFRLAEKRIGEAAEYGVVSFISNSSWLTGRSHPLMRESLLANFHEVWVDNLNGDKYKTGKIIPDGLPGAGTSDQSVFSTDQNVGGIQVGTCVTTLLKRKAPDTAPGKTVVHYRDFWGRAPRKWAALTDSFLASTWDAAKVVEVAARPEGPRPYEDFNGTESNRWRLALRTTTTGGYEAWPSLDALFPTAYQGVNPNRGLDGSLVDTDRDTLEARMKAWFDAPTFETAQSACPALATPRARYDPMRVWQALKGTGYRPERVRPYMVFPMDVRWLYHETKEKLLNEARVDFGDAVQGNQFLVAVPQPRRESETRPLLSSILVDLHAHDRGSVCFPRFLPSLTGAEANLAQTAWPVLRQAYGVAGSLQDAEAQVLVGRLFSLALAVMHSPAYQRDNQAALAEGFAQLPIPKSAPTLQEVAAEGARVGALLDPESDVDALVEDVLGADVSAALAMPALEGGGALRFEDFIITYSYYGGAPGRWEAQAATAGAGSEVTATGNLYLNTNVMLKNVPRAVWKYELGGYPVLKKWLGYRDAKRRNGRPLSRDEVHHFRSMVQRIAAILALHPRLDALYEKAADEAFTAEELMLG